MRARVPRTWFKRASFIASALVSDAEPRGALGFGVTFRDGGVLNLRYNDQRELLEQELTPEQMAEGTAVREHYQRLLFQQMTGELKDFLVSALRVSSRESFANNDWLDLAIVAALPSCCQRDRIREAARDQRDQLAAGSQPVGQVGQRSASERVQGPLSRLPNQNERVGSVLFVLSYSRDTAWVEHWLL